jgi:hypothetical protein
MRQTTGRLEFSLYDLAGWFRQDPRASAERWSEVIARGGFEEHESGLSGDAITLVVPLPDR